jgi:membrane-bound lytic murein transglycosylase B
MRIQYLRIKIFFTLCLLISVILLAVIWANGQSKLFGERADVQVFIQKMVQQYHFDADELTALFNTIQKRPEVLTKIQRPFEERTLWFNYKEHFVTEKRVQDGIRFWQQHEEALSRAEKIYGIPVPVIVAIIGVESNYGEYLGEFKVLDALANIAFHYEKRSDFFKKQLVEFLLLCSEKKMNPTVPLGSYAGAIGQPQFMPSTFRKYAVDFNSSGQIDLTHDAEDVIGSIAKFLKDHGWEKNGEIAIAAKKDQSYPESLPTNVLEEQFAITQLIKDGLSPLVKAKEQTQFGVIKLMEREGPKYWLGLHNMYVLTKYNTHIQYGMAVYELSQEISKQRLKHQQITARVHFASK